MQIALRNRNSIVVLASKTQLLLIPLLLITIISLFMVPVTYTMIQKEEDKKEVAADAVSHQEQSPLQKYANSFAQHFVDPIADWLLPTVSKQLYAQYNYHLKGQDQLPFQSQYTVDHNSRRPDGLYPLISLQHNYPHVQLHDNLLVDDNGRVYCTNGNLFMGKQRKHLVNDMHVCGDRDNNTDMYEPGDIFFHNGMLIERVVKHQGRGKRYYDYHANKQLYLQYTKHLQRQPAPPKSCFGSITNESGQAALERPVVGVEGKLLWVNSLTRNNNGGYAACIGNDVKNYPQLNTVASVSSEGAISNNPSLPHTCVYLEDCIDTVQLHPNRARLIFISVLTGILSIPTYGLTLLHRKLLAHKNNIKKPANTSVLQKVTSDHQDKNKQNNTDIVTQTPITSNSTAASLRENKQTVLSAKNNTSHPQQQSSFSPNSITHDKILHEESQ